MTTNPYAEAVTEALSFTSEDIENAQEAMQEGEWQWFQWLLREKAKQALPVLLAPLWALASGAAELGYQPYAADICGEVRFVVLLDDLRAALDAIEADTTSEGGRS